MLNELFFIYFYYDENLYFVVSLIIFVRLLRLTFDVRRFHDFGASGWWSLLLFIPLINFITILVLFFRRGELSRYDTEYDLRSEIKLMDLSILVLVSFITTICYALINYSYLSRGYEGISTMDMFIFNISNLKLFAIGLVTILTTLLSFISYSKIKVKNQHISILITCFIYSILLYFLIFVIPNPDILLSIDPVSELSFISGTYLIPALLGVYATKVYKYLINYKK
tara:strand:- start:442 stop:1119 length:678 start_codon:yes stop_codon:yes gene_type:complete